MPSLRFLVAASFALVASALAPSASAFCRTTTEPVPAGYDARSQGCWTGGVPIYWKSACVGYSLQKDGTRFAPLSTVRTEVDEAFAQWNRVTCVDPLSSGPPSSSIHVGAVADVDCTEVRYNSGSPNQNVIVFRDAAWPHNDASNTLALTTVTYSPETGEIYDADMEINSAQADLSFQKLPGAGEHDFLSVVTHEAGHFLGLAHAVESTSVMFASYEPGSIKDRTLTADDEAGLCAIYLPSGERVAGAGRVAGGTCDTTPRGGFTTQCTAPAEAAPCATPTQGWTCGVHPRGGHLPVREGAAAAFLACGLLLVRRARR